MLPRMFRKPWWNGWARRGVDAWRDAAASAVAAGVAWSLAVWLFGHAHPVFAAVTAIVCLAPGLPSHGRQAVDLLLGVTVGIVVGEAAFRLLPEGLLVPEGLSLLRLSLGTFFAILLAALLRPVPVVSIQAGVSVVLVLAMGLQTAGLVRFEDVAVGVVVGLLFSQVLLTPDPVRQIDEPAGDLLRRLARGLDACAAALGQGDARQAQQALQTVGSAQTSLAALSAGIDAAQHAARWSLRGRLVARGVADMAARYDRRAVRLYASSLLLVEAVADALRLDIQPVPPALHAAIAGLAERCRRLADGAAPLVAPPVTLPASGVAPGWEATINHGQAVADVLSSLEALHTAPQAEPRRAGESS